MVQFEWMLANFCSVYIKTDSISLLFFLFVLLAVCIFIHYMPIMQIYKCFLHCLILNQKHWYFLYENTYELC